MYRPGWPAPDAAACQDLYDRAVTAAVRLLVIGEFAYNSGSSNVVREYVRAGPAAGFDVRIAAAFGRSDRRVRAELPHEADPRWATHALVIYEGRPFLHNRSLAALEQAIPRARRLVVDCDGHCAPLVNVVGDDNGWPCGHDAWRRAFEAAGSVILQPSIAEAAPGTLRWPYFGMPPASPGSPRPRRLTMQYVGNNWFRARALLEVFAAGRQAIPSARLQVRGRGWDGSSLPGLEHGTYAAPADLAALGIRVARPAPFGRVTETMSQALLSPVLVRPVLSRLGLLTPRMLETAAASTLPVYTEADPQIAALYDDGGALCLGPDPAARIAVILDDLPRFEALAGDIRASLAGRFGYERNLSALRELLA